MSTRHGPRRGPPAPPHSAAPVLAALAAGSFALCAPSLVEAQVVTGRVLDARSLEGIPVAAVQVFDGDERRVGVDVTDTEGRFRIELEAAGGPFRLEADALSHARAVADSLFVAEGETVGAGEILLGTEPLALDGFVVEGQRPRLTPGREWVRRNQLQGRGTFLAGAVILADAPSSLASYVADATDLWVDYDERGTPGLRIPPGRHPRCIEMLVNRWPMRRGGELPVGYRSIDDIPLEHIAAIEVYESYRDLPEGYYWIGNNPDCGIVNVWLWNSW